MTEKRESVEWKKYGDGVEVLAVGKKATGKIDRADKFAYIVLAILFFALIGTAAGMRVKSNIETARHDEEVRIAPLMDYLREEAPVQNYMFG